MSALAEAEAAMLTPITPATGQRIIDHAREQREAETIEQRMERLRRECTVSDTGEHTCMSDPEVEAYYAAWVKGDRR